VKNVSVSIPYPSLVTPCVDGLEMDEGYILFLLFS
jgi:hypothetical protein